VGWWDRWVWSRVANREALTLEQLLAEEGRPTASGEAVTIESALRLSTVWGCVRLLADSVSTLPLHVYRGDDRDPIPTPPLLARPSADHPELADWLWSIMASLLLRGNAWGVITGRSGSTLLPSQCDLVHPDRVAITTEQGRRVIRIGGTEYDREDLFHVKAFPWPGQLEGLSPIAYAREAIGLGIAAERYGAKFFGDSAIPSGVLTTDQRVDPQLAATIQERWRARHQGKRDVAVLGSGAKFQAITIAPEESQFIQTQQFSVSTICRISASRPSRWADRPPATRRTPRPRCAAPTSSPSPCAPGWPASSAPSPASCPPPKPPSSTRAGSSAPPSATATNPTRSPSRPGS
jgi:phage portal protein BeeE